MKVRKVLTVLAWIAGGLVGLAFLGWLGLQVQPAPFPAYPMRSGSIETTTLPQGLPKPVERFYRMTYGDTIPVIETAVLTGRATIKPFGLALPARFRFTHVAGRDYRHYIEATWFGLPFMKVNESYVDGTSRIVIPVIGNDSGPKVEQAANLGLWAESWQFPAIFLTDPRVRWEAVDDDTAILVVPFKGGVEERFVVRFDPRTGEATRTESMRYQRSDSEEKILWITTALEYGKVDGYLVNTIGTATWMSDGRPWATFRLEELQYNADVTDYVRAQGI